MIRPVVSTLLISFCLLTVMAVEARQPKRKPARKPAQQEQLPTQLPPKKSAKTAVSSDENTKPIESPESSSIASGKGAKRIPLDPSTTIRINYGYPAWNRSATKIDSASILMREGSTGRIVQIYLEETQPDSSVFSGVYSINWRNIEQMQTEFYIPPQELLGSVEGMKKLKIMLENRELRRHPFILRRTPTGLQTVEIYDNREQALTAMKAFRAEQQLQTANKKFPSDQQLEVAKLADQLRERNAAAKSLAERIRLVQVESLRLQEMVAKFMALSPAQRNARKAEAVKWATEALEHYRAGRFAEAETSFEKAVELDPETKSYYYQYGITLHRTEKFNRSIVFLQLADDPSVNPAEREFYTALNFYRLKEYSNSIDSFEKVIVSKDPTMMVSAIFYKGLIRFEQKKWDESQAAFQQVLDTSTDPKLDAQAELYLEHILRTKQLEAERSRKWQISGTFGEMFDSNILSVSDSALDQGTASNSEGYRSLLMGSLRYRPIYDDANELAAQLDVLTMYTLDKSLQSDQSLRNTDPTMATLTVPWTYKGLLFGKGYKLDVSPGYETIYMSVEDNETKEISSSLILNFTNMLVMNNSWFANYNLETRSDTSKLNSSTGDNDSSAFKVKLANNNLIFISEDKSKMLQTEASYSLNQAKGINSTYNRIDLALGYLQPLPGEFTGNVKLGYFLLKYPDKADGRTDNSYTLTTSLSRKLSEILSLGLMANYNINNSNVESNTYKKWTAMATLSAQYGF